MLRLRKGDLWKAIGLILLIVAVFGFVIWNFRRLTRPQPVAPVAAPAQTQAAAAQPQAAEMFAARLPGLAERLGRAHSAPDPFRPYLSLTGNASAPPSPPRQQRQATRVRPLPPLPGETEQSNIELIGIVSGTSPLAVLGDGTRHYYVRAGDSLPNGWSVAAIYSTSVTLSKGRDRVRLPLTSPPEASPRPAGL